MIETIVVLVLWNVLITACLAGIFFRQRDINYQIMIIAHMLQQTTEEKIDERDKG